jgi:hypothetical protein
VNFVPIPKNASTAICRALGQGHVYDMRASDFPAPRVAVIRHPVDRMVSLWKFCRYHAPSDELRLLATQDFEDFALDPPEHAFTKPQAYWLDAPTRLVPFERVAEEFGLAERVNASLGDVDVTPAARAAIEQRYSEDLNLYVAVSRH